MSASEHCLLSVSHLVKKFGGLVAINDVSLEIMKSEVVSIIGPNGAGKTTFFNMMTGLVAPDSGTITLGNRVLNRCSPDAIARLGIARTFQNIRIFPSMSALENVLVACDSSLAEAGYVDAVLRTKRFRQDESNKKIWAEECLESVGIGSCAAMIAGSLSYGDQRRLEIARALALRPKIMLLDEPAAGMNSAEKNQLKDVILTIKDRFKFSVVLIDHDMKMIMSMSDRVIVLDYGTKIAEGLPQEIQKDPKVIAAYLGGTAS